MMSDGDQAVHLPVTSWSRDILYCFMFIESLLKYGVETTFQKNRLLLALYVHILSLSFCIVLFVENQGGRRLC
jgi:hypothetical protein